MTAYTCEQGYCDLCWPNEGYVEEWHLCRSYPTDVMLYARLRWLWHRLVGRW